MANLDNYLKNIFDLLNKNEFDKALELCDQNTQVKIEHIVYNFKGAIYLKKKDLIKAQENFLFSIKSNKDFIDPYKNLFLIYNNKKKFSKLLEIAFKILEFDTKSPIYNFQIAYALEKVGRLSKSLEYYEKAQKFGFKDKKKILNNIANIYFNLGKIDKSIKLYENAYLNSTDDKILINNLLGAYLEKRDIKKSKYYLNEAKKLDANYINFKLNKAKYLFLVNKIDEAINLLEQIISIDDDIASIALLCKIYFRTNRLSHGNKLLNDKFLSYPNDPKLLRFKGFRSLIDGDFDKGWKLYELRHSNLDKRFPKIPEWNGEDLSSKKILIYNEQGIGDAIQFSKYLINLNKKCKNIDFIVNKNLYDLFDTSNHDGLNLITEDNIDLDKYNFKISLGSLVKFFYKDINLTKKNLIKIDLNEINSFKKEIDKKKLNIGIAWSGNFYGPKEPHRSIPLDKFKDIISSDCNFYCLQNEIWESDQKIFDQINIINKGNLKLKPLCAFIYNLDLVISSDTSILHLAASLGKETWGVLSLDPDWRWGKFIEFYKYENIKFYRQNEFNNWENVIQLIKKDLEIKLKSQS
jgi:tetratricopeptide (TPR) repeat protein